MGERKFEKGERVLVRMEDWMTQAFKTEKEEKGIILDCDEDGCYNIKLDKMENRNLYFYESEIIKITKDGKKAKMEQKFNKGDEVLVDVYIDMQKLYGIESKTKGTVKSYEGFGTYLVKLEEISYLGEYESTHYFSENEMTKISEIDNDKYDQELEQFSLDIHFAIIGWKIDNLLDKYNETKDKSYLKKCKEIMED